jgi:hypothetical protein
MRHKQKKLKVYPVGNSNRAESRKLKVVGVAALLPFPFSLSTVSAQTMYVKESSGTQTAFRPPF